MKRTVSNKSQPQPPTLRPIVLGGTNGTYPQEAIESLGGIHQTKIGNALGVTPLDNKLFILEDYIPPLIGVAHPALDGPVEVYTTNLPQTYLITNFDSKTTYTITTNKGSVSVNGDTVMFTPPPTPGITIITINGKNFPITVLSPYISSQSVVNPTVIDNNNINKSLHPVIETTYDVQGIWNPDYNVHYQVATDNQFSDIVFDTISSEQSVMCSLLAPGSVYYVRIKYTIIGGFDESNIALNSFNIDAGWSSIVSFTTRPTVYPVNEISILLDPEPSSFPSGNESLPDAFGVSLKLSEDGAILLVSNFLADEYSLQYVGHFFVYKLINDVWVEQIKIPCPDQIAYSAFALELEISVDKQTIAVTQPGQGGGNGSPLCKLYIYKTTVLDDYTTLTLIDSITPSQNPNLNISGFFDIHLTNNFDYLSLSTYQNNNWLMTDYLSRTYIYHFDGTNLVEEFNVQGALGENLSAAYINESCTKIVFLSTFVDSNNTTVKIYDKIAGVWILSYSVPVPDGTYPGVALVVFNNFQEYFITTNYSEPNQLGKSQIHHFKFENDAWVLKQSLEIPDSTYVLNDGSSIWPLCLRNNDTLLFACTSAISIIENRSPTDHYGNYTGAVFVFEYNSNLMLWEFKQRYIANDYYFLKSFGTSCSASKNGDIVVIGSILPVPYPSEVYTFK